MPSPVVLLYQALVAEYESQGIQPPFPKEELEERRRSLEQELARPEMDAQELDRQVDATLVKEFYAWLHEKGIRRSALCFSGGGIRSATFGLGVVQGLARHGMIGQFDYLSTVSGGGYLGSWLTGWIQRERQRLGDPQAAVKEVESRLRHLPDRPLDPEPKPLRYLRSYSRYMSPRFGLLSADTWTLVATVLRNLLLNWLVLLPLIAAVLVIPRVSLLFVRMAHRPWFQAHQEWILPAVFWTAVALGIVAIAYIGANRPSLGDRSSFPKRLRSQEWFLGLCLLPLALMAIIVGLYWAWIRTNAGPISELEFVIFGWTVSPLTAFIFFGVVLHLGGFLLSRIWVRKYVLGELTVVVLTGALGGGLAWFPASTLFASVNTGLAAERFVCFGAPILLFLFLLAATLFVGVASYFMSDADREWLARCGAWVLIAIVVRTAFSGIVIFGPVLLLQVGVLLSSSIGGISGLLTLLLGGGSRTKAQKGGKGPQEKKTRGLLDIILEFAAPIFAVFVFVVLSLATTLLIRWVTETFTGTRGWHLHEGASYDPWRLLNIVYYSPWWAVLSVLAFLLLIGGLMGAFVDINRFSLHAGYRDRLVRAYLGASRPADRKPNPFTGFDENDNVQIKDLRGNRPLHVVNMTLNLVGGKDLAWQDRKAETFTATALHAGSFRLGYRDSAEYGLHRDKKAAISLGTVMAISGAAASPNMGYHSSPVVTFLLALFNVRLGWWLGNPGRAGDHTYNTPGPRFAPRPYFAEAFGLTDSRHPYVYLSDGGHFENLGIYEMVLRRCNFIVLSDAGADPDFTFESLGNAVSKIRIDLGVPIQFEKILIPPRKKGQELEIYDVTRYQDSPAPYCAIARICYSCVDAGAKDGLLLYVKPSLNGTEPVDVFHYARMHPTFPHEPTSDQLYTESQFESYRALGSHAMGTILTGLAAEATLEDLFKKIEKELGSPPAC